MESFQCTADTFFGSGFADPPGGAGLSQGLFLKVTQQHSVAIGDAQSVHSFVQNGSNEVPRFIGWDIQGGFHNRLLLALLAALVISAVVCGSQTRSLIKPTA